MKNSVDLLLGKVAVRTRICTQEQVDECLQLQADGGAAVSLGDLLLVKGYLTKSQLREILAKEHRIEMRCSSCLTSFKVLTFSGAKAVSCPKCRGILEEAPRESHVCVICNESFDEPPDASGRVRCPSCQSTFASHRTP